MSSRNGVAAFAGIVATVGTIAIAGPRCIEHGVSVQRDLASWRITRTTEVYLVENLIYM